MQSSGSYYLSSSVAIANKFTAQTWRNKAKQLTMITLLFSLAACGGGSEDLNTDSAALKRIQTVDTEPPQQPVGLKIVDKTASTITLSWDATIDNVGVSQYTVFEGANSVTEVSGSRVTISGLTPASNYAFRVSAIDSAGNQSEYSEWLNTMTLATTQPSAAPTPNNSPAVTPTPNGQPAVAPAHVLLPVQTPPQISPPTSPQLDTQLPTAPQNLRVVVLNSDSVNLTWDVATDNLGVTGYEIFTGDVLAMTVMQPTATLGNLQANSAYQIKVRAADAAGNKSNFSLILAVNVPGAPANPPAIPPVVANPPPATSVTPPPVVANGAALYQQLCVSCHGADGQGSATIIGLTRNLTAEQLTQTIETTMPPGETRQCTGSCATAVAEYVYANFTDKTAPDATLITEPLAGLAEGEEQLNLFCARQAAANRNNVVRDVFCSGTRPQLTGLQDLQRVLGLEFRNPTTTGRGNNGRNGNPSFALTGHSSSLVARFTSAINPRAIIFTPPSAGNLDAFVAMGFVRGEQFVELAVGERGSREISFLLLSFKNACSATNTCTPGDLLTPAIETNWVDYTIYDEQNTSNTILDCLQCHQTNGPGTQKILRMQELEEPWTHWFRGDTRSALLTADFLAAHGTNESYAGIPPSLIPASDPEELEDLVRNTGFGNQPNEFPTDTIEHEVERTTGQPANNDVPGVSPTWNVIYERSVRGEAIPVPYHDIKVTDSQKLAAMTQSYQSFINGTLTATALPNIRDVFYDAQLAMMGFGVKAGLDGQGIIVQACTQCHNSRLDQTISRARFNVDVNAMSNLQGGSLAGMDRDLEIGVAITRLQLPKEDVRKMPPDRFKTLSQDEIDRAVTYLCSLTVNPIPQCVGR